MAVQRVLLSVVMLLVWTCGPADSKAVPCLDGVKETHNSITSPLGLTDSSVGASPIFSAVIHNITSSFQKHEQIELMNHTLAVYVRILDNILDHEHNTLLDTLPEKETRDKVHSALVTLRKEVVHLKTHYYNGNKDMEKRKEVLNTLNKIQVDDMVSQKKALAEFKEIYNAASVIASKKCPGSHSS